MAMRSLDSMEVTGRRVLVRVDFNVPLSQGESPEVVDDTRIIAALPTIRWLIEHGAKVVLCSHLGRPKGKPTPKYSLLPCAVRLAEKLGPPAEVLLTDESTGDAARRIVGALHKGQIAMLENLRFDPGEEANNDNFARSLAQLADMYVNDAFGAAHRAHASVVGVVRHLPERAAGLLMLREVNFLSRLLAEVERPYVAILGGAKVSDKIDVIENLLARIDVLVLGGALANTFLAARGMNLSASRVENDCLAVASSILARAAERKVQVLLPVDLRVAASVDAEAGEVYAIDRLPENAMALDIGPATAALFRQHIAPAKTIFWNGPMGVYEKPVWAQGTRDVAHAVAEAKALSVVGGGDSVAALTHAGLLDRVSHASTGGGASLEFLEGRILPGLQALET